MQYPAFIVLFSTLIAKICFASLTIETSYPDESLVEATIEILESCYADRFDTVGIAGPSAKSVIKKISSRKTIMSTTLIDENSTITFIDESCKPLRYKLQVFVVTMGRSKSFKDTLLGVGTSKWWNHLASFLLIDSGEKKNGCTKAFKKLRSAWKIDLLNVKFICLHQTEGRLIYTLNPYTNEAPNPWRQENIYEGLEGHNFTLFVRNYDNDDSPCDELDFDKTVNLGGYPITVFNRDKFFKEDWGHNYDHRQVELQWKNVTDHLLTESLNARWVITMNDSSLTEAYTDGIESYDVEFPMLRAVDGLYPSCFTDEYTYPVVQREMYIMAPYRGHKSQLDKLISVLDKNSRFGVLVVLTITLLFFKFLMREPLIPAIMNLVRLICNAGLERIPRRTAHRIYLASLFILVVTIQGIYSGKLASLLTKNVRLPTVNSLEDVIRSNYTLIVPAYWYMVFQYEPNLKERLGLEARKLYGDQSDAEEAVLGYKSNLVDLALRYKLHVSRKPVAYENMGYRMREDWPLVERINTVFGRLAASGIPNLLYARVFQSNMRILDSYEREDEEPELKPLSLEHLGFAFKILAIGWGLGIIVFIVEVATKNWN